MSGRPLWRSMSMRNFVMHEIKFITGLNELPVDTNTLLRLSVDPEIDHLRSAAEVSETLYVWNGSVFR